MRIFHVDLDAFFASVEQLDFPEYKGKPLIVGGEKGKRGVVSTCSYEARKFGVHSAMPIDTAYKLCPNGIFVPVRMQRYLEFSKRVMECFGDFTPDVREISVDEAFLDMSGTERLFGDNEEAGRRLKNYVHEKTGLTVSVGIAQNRYLAKLASAYKKPDGLTIVDEGKEIEFIDSIPIGKLWGAGEKTQNRFKELNIRTIAELRGFKEESLRALLGSAMGSFLYKAVRGIDPGIFADEVKSHSISSETTFEVDIKDDDALHTSLLALSEQVCFRLFSSHESASTIGIKIRYSDFTTVQAQVTSKRNIVSSLEVYEQAKKLFDSRRDHVQAIRLLGIRISKVEEGLSPSQGELFEDSYQKSSKVERAILDLQKKGKGKVTRARLIDIKKEEP